MNAVVRTMTPDDLKMPACHSADIVLLMADRYTRASAGMIEWATLAKQCIGNATMDTADIAALTDLLTAVEQWRPGK